MPAKVEIMRVDITTLAVDAIVNAANNTLLGGGGVDGAIHRAAGPELVAECSMLGGCVTGDAKITRGYQLPARHVIHTVGPVWQDGHHDEPALLRSSYDRCFSVAQEHGLTSLAFPAISCGVYGYPMRQGCRIALEAAQSALANNPQLQRIIFTPYSEPVEVIYREMLAEVFGG